MTKTHTYKISDWKVVTSCQGGQGNIQAAASRYKPQITRIFLSNYVTWLVVACRPPDRLVFYPRLNHKPVNPSSNNQPKE